MIKPESEANKSEATPPVGSGTLVRCAACKWWSVEIPKGISPLRPCNNPKLRSCGLVGQGWNPDEAGVDDGYGTIETGPEFGCVHGNRASTPNK